MLYFGGERDGRFEIDGGCCFYAQLGRDSLLLLFCCCCLLCCLFLLVVVFARWLMIDNVLFEKKKRRCIVGGRLYVCGMSLVSNLGGRGFSIYEFLKGRHFLECNLLGETSWGEDCVRGLLVPWVFV